MGEKKRFANDPLLFIHQPTVSTPKAPMQDSYTTPKKRRGKKSPEEQQPNKEEPKQEIPKRRYSSKKQMKEKVDEEDVVEEKDEPKDDESENEGSQNQRKQFKDMTVKERIEYFTNTSDYAPKLKCEVKTDKKSHRGIILEFKEDVVHMQVGRRVTQIPFADIKQVKMLGF